MKLEEIKKICRKTFEQIGDNRLDEAFDNLKVMIDYTLDQKHEKQFTILKFRWTNIKDEERNGVINRGKFRCTEERRSYFIIGFI